MHQHTCIQYRGNPIPLQAHRCYMKYSSLPRAWIHTRSDQLGELNEWSKKTDTELAVHVPMIIRVPWKTQSIGKRTVVKAELVDMFVAPCSPLPLS